MLFTLPFSLLMLALVCLLTCCLIMTETWFWAKRIKNAGVVDIFWSFNFPVIAFLMLWLARGWHPRKLLICGMVIIAGTRLGLHLLIRITRHLKEEEPRYKQLRKEWAPRPDRKFFWFFQAQALSNVLLCIPFFIITANWENSFSAWEYAGAALWLIAVIGEATADRQLASFKKDSQNKGKVCRRGLWNYSRHPNYFFEWLMWMSYFVFALGSPNGILAIVSPAVILYLLLKVTGIPATEEQSIRSKGDAYRAYQQSTSVFVPWFKSNNKDRAHYMWYDPLIEQNRLPDLLLRSGIRKLLRQRLREEDKGDPETQQAHLQSLIERLKVSPIAVNTTQDNRQHYEVPASFFEHCLGKHLKYSCAYWLPGVTDLDEAEREMLELTCMRAELEDGQQVLELGCGWGSLSLFMAARFPQSQFTVVSNSHSQKEYIDRQMRERGLDNLRVITADMNAFAPGHPIDAASFDRVLSVEMFEHMRNYQWLMEKIAAFLKPEGKLFVHIFTHTRYAYLFEVKADNDWMSKYFFTGGIMPSDHLLLYFPDHLTIEQHWQVSGMHYALTAEAWLRNMDSHQAGIMPVFEGVYGKDESVKWWAYWRLFFLACAELWSYRDGKEWIVSHYLFRKTGR